MFILVTDFKNCTFQCCSALRLFPIQFIVPLFNLHTAADHLIFNGSIRSIQFHKGLIFFNFKSPFKCSCILVSGRWCFLFDLISSERKQIFFRLCFAVLIGCQRCNHITFLVCFPFYKHLMFIFRDQIQPGSFQTCSTLRFLLIQFTVPLFNLNTTMNNCFRNGRYIIGFYTICSFI